MAVAANTVERLHIGGREKKDGWHILNIEPGEEVDFVGDCCDLSRFEDGTIGEVYASHVIEHLSHTDELARTLTEINRIMRPGGKLYLAVPDLERLVQLYFNPNAGTSAKIGVINILFGGQTGPNDFHKCAFDKTLLSQYLNWAGFGDAQQVAEFGIFTQDATTYRYEGVPVSLNLIAHKRGSSRLAPPAPAMQGKEPEQIMGPKFTIPDHMLASFTMNGNVPITLYFLSETSGGTLHWTNEYFNKMKQKAALVAGTETAYCYDTDPHLCRMLKAHSIAGKDVLVVGSVHPFYEALVSHFQGRPATLEYREIVHDIPGLRTYTVREFERHPVPYDIALSISSIEHSGLGRYGDPIDPDGDLKAMRKLKSCVAKEGILFLAVPVGKDAVCWNAHRIYGRARLPLLLDGWRLIDSAGFSEEQLDAGQLGIDFVQPVFVLQNI
ncbi:class I SAM-dependent methyltransferase [Geomonas propionica]|uniref:DUF268 domain-containing protein n=1 Tax=Geomonas propionica TaxID=2798582 RepID=A0ABS0YT70_9BACT|nr:DUF268 domain-containing protein [Geomonas propionica]MBJ6801179.1 DUF268 domain-containing protein [Geomonas propionica]